MAAASLLTLGLLPLTSCEVPGDPIGSILDSLSARIDAVITNASAESQILVTTAAGQVDLAVDNALSAFATMLDEGINKVDDATQRTIADLEALVADLEGGVTQVLNEAISGAQQIVNTLPFTNKNPQVTSYSPHFIANRSGSTVQLNLRGNFVWQFEKSLATTLVLDGQVIQANLSTTSEIGFELPLSAFSSAPGEITRKSIDVTIPYEHGTIFKDVKPGVFRVLISILPPSPVTALTLTREETVTGEQTRSLVAPAGASRDGGGWTLRSDNWGTGKCQDEHDVHSIAATPGWKIVPSSVNAVVAWGKSLDATKVQISSAQPTGFVLEAWTYAKCFLGISSGSGVVTYFVEYTESQPVTSTTSTTVDLLPFGWGDQLVQPVPRGKWAVHVTLWNGQTRNIASTDVSNPYVRINDDGDHITISAADPASLIPTG